MKAVNHILQTDLKSVFQHDVPICDWPAAHMFMVVQNIKRALI